MQVSINICKQLFALILNLCDARLSMALLLNADVRLRLVRRTGAACLQKYTRSSICVCRIFRWYVHSLCYFVVP